jgi:hypothetical protein
LGAAQGRLCFYLLLRREPLMLPRHLGEDWLAVSRSLGDTLSGTSLSSFGSWRWASCSFLVKQKVGFMIVIFSWLGYLAVLISGTQFICRYFRHERGLRDGVGQTGHWFGFVHLNY